MSPFNLLRPSDLMIGIDLHDAIVPPLPEKVKFVPHFVIASLRGGAQTGTSGFASTVKHTPTVKVDFDDGIQRSTDIGSWIDHVSYNLLIPIIVAGSASKSEFGAHTVKAEGRPVATAVLKTSTINLNCSDPTPLPTGYVDAPCTVRAGMTLGDFVAGALEGVWDMAVSYEISLLLGPLGDIPGLGRLLGNHGARFLEQTAQRVVGLHWGSPLGHSFPWAAYPGDQQEQAFDELADRYDGPKHRTFL